MLRELSSVTYISTVGKLLDVRRRRRLPDYRPLDVVLHRRRPRQLTLGLERPYTHMYFEVKPIIVNVMKVPENAFLDNAAQALRANVAVSLQSRPVVTTTATGAVPEPGAGDGATPVIATILVVAGIVIVAAAGTGVGATSLAVIPGFTSVTAATGRGRRPGTRSVAVFGTAAVVLARTPVVGPVIIAAVGEAGAGAID
jgi:hypothetical protein